MLPIISSLLLVILLIFIFSLQAFIRSDLEILKDWCHEGVSNWLFHHPILSPWAPKAILKGGGRLRKRALGKSSQNRIVTP